MKSIDTDRKRRAWELAHKILSIVRILPAREDKRLLLVGTAEIAAAMGVSGRANLEELQRFVFAVIAFLRGHGVHVVCGCGYLSLMVSAEEGSEEIVTNRETTSFEPDNLEAYFAETVLAAGADRASVRQICEIEDERT